MNGVCVYPTTKRYQDTPCRAPPRSEPEPRGARARPRPRGTRSLAIGVPGSVFGSAECARLEGGVPSSLT